jgi:hypothetical protein
MAQKGSCRRSLFTNLNNYISLYSHYTFVNDFKNCMSCPALQILVSPESVNEYEKLLAPSRPFHIHYPAFAWEVRPLFAVSLILSYNSGSDSTKTEFSAQYLANNNNNNRSRDSVVGIETSYGLDDRGVGVRVPVGSRIFPSPDRPDRLWGPPNLLSNEYQGIFPRG